MVPLVSIDEFAKRVSGQMGQELGEDRGTRVHGNSPPGRILGGDATRIRSGEIEIDDCEYHAFIL